MQRRPAALLAGLALTLCGHAARADLRVTIDKDRQRMSVAVDGVVRHDWPVSTGLTRYDTPNGAYRPFRTELTHFSREWDNAPMPHAIFFSQSGHAIHATNQTRHLGRPASHGCVRLSPRNAATLFALVRQQGLGRTRISVEGDLAAAATARQRPTTPVRTARRVPQEQRLAGTSLRDRAWEQESYYGAPVRRITRDPFDEGYGSSPWVVYDGGY